MYFAFSSEKLPWARCSDSSWASPRTFARGPWAPRLHVGPGCRRGGGVHRAVGGHSGSHSAAGPEEAAGRSGGCLAPFITTLVDGTGLFIYFTVAKILLGLD